MIPKGLFTQIAMVILSIAIIITYIKPAFDEIGSVQENIGIYKTERGKVEMVNSKLLSLVNQLESVSNEDERRLNTYLPDSVDRIAVQRDLKLITNEAGLIYRDVVSEEAGKKSKQQTVDEENLPEPYLFSLSVEGRYEQIKDLFQLLEQNNYPLEIHSLDIQQTELGMLSADIKLVTYAHRSEINSN